jgi:hypothetical protein
MFGRMVLFLAEVALIWRTSQVVADTFCRIFLHQLVNAPVNVVKMLENFLCSSRDGVPLGPEKDTCQQDSLSKWIDCYQFRLPSFAIRQYRQVR